MAKPDRGTESNWGCSDGCYINMATTLLVLVSIEKFVDILSRFIDLLIYRFISICATYSNGSGRIMLGYTQVDIL